MTGPEHYKEAEKIVRSIRLDQARLAQRATAEAVAQALAEAQVHATLALAAATINAAYGDLSIPADDEWRAAGAIRP
ncbi:MAG TPA: hypothetical protein VGF29_00385 [Hyphomicrobiaceae bacterium]|jgi:hypothetical protein